MGNAGAYTGPLEKVGPCQWKIPRTYREDMRVDGLIFADDALIEQIKKDQGPEQVVNVATLPGIQKASLAMPDIHWGYGFCIGGVAATDPEEGGVISPGRRRLRHQLRRPAAPVRPRVGRRQGPDQAAGRPALPRHPHRRRPERAVTCSTSRSSIELMEQGSSYVVEPGLRDRPRPARSPRPAAGSTGADPGRVSDRAITRGLRPVRHARLGQPLPRSPGRRPRARRRGRRGDGPARGADHRPDPLGLARAGLPGLRRLPGGVQERPQEVRLRRCPTGSSPARRCGARRGRLTWARCGPRPTTPGATASS